MTQQAEALPSCEMHVRAALAATKVLETSALNPIEPFIFRQGVSMITLTKVFSPERR